VNGSYKNKVTTDYTSAFAIDGIVRDVTLIKHGYEKRVLKAEEMTDTIEMLPNYNRIDEVVVYGKMLGKHIPVLDIVQKNIKSMANTVVSGEYRATS